jgi:putative addiction module component (TIGR02574 family)
MTQPIPDPIIQQLNSSEKLDLITQLWDSLPTEGIPIPEWHREEIEQRITAADASPEIAIPWDEVKQRLRIRS